MKRYFFEIGSRESDYQDNPHERARTSCYSLWDRRSNEHVAEIFDVKDAEKITDALNRLEREKTLDKLVAETQKLGVGY